MESMDQILAGSPALAGLPADALQAMRTRLQPRSFPAGSTIIRQGATDKDLYLLGTGLARVTMTNEAGQEVEVGRLAAGDVFGEWSLLTNRPRAATVTAETQVDAYILHKADYEIVVDNTLSLVQYLVRALSIREREYAGLVAADLNAWGAQFGGMRKDEVLTSSFLTVASAPTTPFSALVLAARFRLWATTVEMLAAAGPPDGLALATDALGLPDDLAREGPPLARALASIVHDLSREADFAPWRELWVQEVRQGLDALAVRTEESRLGYQPDLINAYLETLLVASQDTWDQRQVEALHELTRRAARTIAMAHEASGEMERLRREQVPGYGRPQDIRMQRRAIEAQLSEVEHRWRELPRAEREAATPCMTATRLLTEFFARVNEVRPRMAALPY
jgi:CRP-like cAMP-binding protein